MHAVRNIRLCTKDCLCLYVCPVGATDTETGQIDANKCISGCRECVDSCPSHAISLAPEVFPPQQKKTEAVKKTLFSLADSKTKQENAAVHIAGTSDDPIVRQIADTLIISNRVMAEDLIREAGYMLPQSGNTHDLLQSLLNTPQPDDFPADVVKRLLKLIKSNEKNREIRDEP